MEQLITIDKGALDVPYQAGELTAALKTELWKIFMAKSSTVMRRKDI